MTKKYKVNITKNAQIDFEHIFFYIAEDNINNPQKFISELEEKIYSLETFPARFSFIPENLYMGANYRHVVHKKYRIVYRLEDKVVYILRVIHGSKLLEL